MKYICIILFYLSVLLVGCTYEEADIFSASPAERMNKALKDNTDSLQSAVNGWAMEYFATDHSAGYTMLVKFEKSGKATIAGKNELTKNLIVSDSCMYEMIGDNGPVLTFNTYNNVLHAFSNPVNPDGYGLEGDYEFIVMKNTANQMILKGKKRGTTILMNKIPENISWTQYFAEIDAMNSLLFGNNAPKLGMNLSNNYSFSMGSTHIFSVLQNGADANTSTDAPFIITRTGLRFQTLQELENKSFQTFTLNDDKSALVCFENTDVKLVGPDSLSVYFGNNLNIWTFETSTLGPKIKATYDLMVQSLVIKYKATNIKLSLKYSILRKSQELMISFTSGKTKLEGNIDFLYTSVDQNTITLTSKATGDNNGKTFYSNIVGCKEMTELLTSNFSINSETSINPQKIKFTHKTDADIWFSVSCQ